jgi:hypothetical protein
MMPILLNEFLSLLWLSWPMTVTVGVGLPRKKCRVHSVEMPPPWPSYIPRMGLLAACDELIALIWKESQHQKLPRVRRVPRKLVSTHRPEPVILYPSTNVLE